MAGGDHELKLLGSTNPSPFVTRVELALALKGLSYDLVAIDLNNKSDLLLASNPVHHKVPVLIHDGKPISESRIILEYLDDAFPSTYPLLPSDPHHRAVARFWAAYIDDKYVASWGSVYVGKMEEERAERMRQMVAAVEALEGLLKEGKKPFFSGEIVRLVDVTLGALIPRTKANEVLSGTIVIDDVRTPQLAAWVERFCELDVARKVLPSVDEVVEYIKMRLAQRATAADASKK
uniref:Glutathione S-transferase n=1 Tax=Leersia perrieri TaxID=77586 RepID=A0A0D9XIY7_9ORYZ